MKGPVRGWDWLGGLGEWNRAYRTLFCFQCQGLTPASNWGPPHLPAHSPCLVSAAEQGENWKEKNKNPDRQRYRWLSRWRKEQGGKKEWITQRDLLTAFHKQRNAQAIWARSLWKDYLPVLLLSKDIKQYGISFGSAVPAVPPLRLLCTPSPLTGEQNKK